MLNVKELRKDFKNKEEEIEYLRSLIMEKEEENSKTDSFNLLIKEDKQDKAHQINEILHKYKSEKAENLLDKKFALDGDHVTTISLGLAPEEHDDKLQKLIDIFLTEGVRNTFSVLGKMSDSHLEDDFHRFLVQYLLKSDFERGRKVFGSYKETMKALDSSLYEVIMPTEKSMEPGARVCIFA